MKNTFLYTFPGEQGLNRMFFINALGFLSFLNW